MVVVELDPVEEAGVARQVTWTMVWAVLSPETVVAAAEFMDQKTFPVDVLVAFEVSAVATQYWRLFWKLETPLVADPRVRFLEPQQAVEPHWLLAVH